MAGNDEQFENYLREFEPRRPRALPAQSWGKPEQWRLRRLAAAAALVIAMGSALWLAVRQHRQGASNLAITMAPISEPKPATAHLSLSQLNQMALGDPALLDEELAKDSREVLPDFRSEGSTLRVLAKE